MNVASSITQTIFGLWLVGWGTVGAVQAGGPIVTDYPSIQAAIDAHPGKMIEVPAGDFEISEKLRLKGEDGGLWGYGRIIQTNAAAPIIEIENATDVRIIGITLTRPEQNCDTSTEAILAMQCERLRIENVRVINNRTASSAIALRDCRDCEIRGCEVLNYSSITIDDRTSKDLYGYAFRCISGVGISVQASTGTLIESCRVIERNLLTTPEVQARYDLGTFVKKNPVKGTLISDEVWNRGTTENWHQGSGIVVSSPEETDQTRLIGNYVENAGQGLDIHSDHIIISQNIVKNAGIGMKAMHGSRNVLILGNQFSRCDLWAIGLMPGAASHPATEEGKPETANSDGASIIAHNIISDFGHGHSNWIWGNERSPFKFDGPQEADDPPLEDVLIQGNVIQSIGEPRYRYAVVISQGPGGPKGLHFSGNLFHPGKDGVCNVELMP